MSILSDIAQQLAPGEVLDDLVARYVMGWHGVTQILREGGPGTLMWTSLSGQISSPVMPISEWHPSGNAVQALRVLDACGDGVSRDGRGRFSGAAIRAVCPTHWEIALSENMMGPEETIWGMTFPLAVCRAAVAAALWKEIEKDILERRKTDLEKVTVPTPSTWEEEALQKLRAAPPPPIVVRGKPVSESIIEDRE